MNEYSLLSPERVQLKLNIVGIGSRFAACFIDSIFQSILLVFLIAGAISLHVSGLIRWEMQNFRDYLLLAILLLLGFAILYGYFILFETIWNGQTPGKRFLHLRVVGENGSPVTFLAVLIRNLIRIFDALPSGYAIGIVSMLLTNKNQRLGDLAAGTLVIRESGEQAPVTMDFQVIDTPWSGAARLRMHDITEADFAVLKKYLLCRDTMKRESMLSMDEKLILFFSQKLGLKPEETGDPLEFLRQVAALYQHR